MFRRIFDVTGRRRKLHNEGLYNLIIPIGTLRHGWKDATKIVQKFQDRNQWQALSKAKNFSISSVALKFLKDSAL
jgi:hypothetical protein